MLDNDDIKRLRTQKDKILQALKDAGPEGMTNAELSKISLRYGGHLGILYREGYKIQKIKLDGGLFRYIFLSEPSQKQIHNKAIDDFVEEVLNRFGGEISAWDIRPLMNEMNFQMNRKSGYYQGEI